MFVKLSRRLKRKRCLRKLTILFLIVLVFIYSYTDEVSYKKSNEFSMSNADFVQIESDINVNTSGYLKNFHEFESIKKQFQISSNHKHLKRELHESQRINKSNYLILEYTKFFRQTKYCQYFDNNERQSIENIFINECPFKNCAFTCNKNLAKEADAVLFHEADVNEEQLNDNNYIARVAELHRTMPDQIFLLWNDEANKVKADLDLIKFNWTMSFRLDSEVSDCSYGCFYEKTNKNSNDMRSVFLEEFYRRKNEALWFVSNCRSRFRTNMALQISQQLPINIFGQCSLGINIKSMFRQMKVGSIMSTLIKGVTNAFINYFRDCGKHSTCEIEQINRNKFYFSFESKNCSNTYITEKFYRILRFNLIPVVIQPAKHIYEMIAPPNSFIHAQVPCQHIFKNDVYMRFFKNLFI